MIINGKGDDEYCVEFDSTIHVFPELNTLIQEFINNMNNLEYENHKLVDENFKDL